MFLRLPNHLIVILGQLIHSSIHFIQRAFPESQAWWLVLGFQKPNWEGRVAERSLELEVMSVRKLCVKGVAWAGEDGGCSSCSERASKAHQMR